jgi:hypothetical protein
MNRGSFGYWKPYYYGEPGSGYLGRMWWWRSGRFEGKKGERE